MQKKVARALSDVLKLRPKEKIEFFEHIATTRDGSSLASLQMEKEADRASVVQLVKLVTSEQKKSRFDHVTTVVRAIRWSLIDDEEAMREMVKHGLDKVILTSITKLIQQASKAGSSPHLQSILSSTSYMFDWEFFADRYYSRFLDEMLLILTTCNDCDDNLFAEAACVLLAMCSTNVSAVRECLAKKKRAQDLLKKVFNDLPRSKSFFYQALLVELSYRLSRQNRKENDFKTSLLCLPLVAALPVHLGRSLADIRPKNFRQQTRVLLNEFNLHVGVVKTHELVKLECKGSSSLPITLIPAGWIDLGGISLEIEFSTQGKSRQENGTIKLPYKAVQRINSDKRTSRVTITVHEDISLAELAEGVNDSEWAKVKKVSLSLFVKSEVLSLILEQLSNLIFPRRDEDFVQVETKLIKTEVLEGVTLPDKHPKAHSKEHYHKEKTTSTNNETKRRSDFEADGGSVVRRRQLPNTAHAKKELPRHSELTMNGSELLVQVQKEVIPNSLIARTSRRSEGKDDTVQPICQRNPITLARSSFSRRKSQNSCKMLCKNDENNNDNKNTQEKDRNSGQLVPKELVHDEDVVKDDGDRHRVNACTPAQNIRLEQTARQMNDVYEEEEMSDWSKSFRTVQSEQLRKFQCLVEEIAETNCQFRQVNMGRLCHNVSAQSAAVLSERRQRLIDDDVFDSVICRVHANQVKRSDINSNTHRNRAALEDVMSETSVAEANVSRGLAHMMTGIEKRVQHEWKHDLDRVNKKLRSDISQRVSSAKAKLAAIEKTFSTDDLLMMQRMLQRI